MAVEALFGLLVFILVFGSPILVGFVKIIRQYEKGVLFTLGKYSGIREPGLNLIIPVIQKLVIVDLRIKTVDVPKQEVMTRDNVPSAVNAVVYFRVLNPEAAVLKIQNYTYATSQYAQTALRDIVGSYDLDTVLSEREMLANEIKKIVDKETDEWGIDVTAIKIQDIELPTDMKRVMAKQAEAEREKRSVIIKAEGEVTASKNLAKAAHTLSASRGALHLRTLSTLNDLSSDQSNTVIFAIPLEVLRAFEKFNDMAEKKTE